MGMPPDVMKQALQRGAPPSNLPPSKPPGVAGPGAAPMMTPQKPEGQMAGARVQVLLAQKMLEQALVAFGAGDEEGKAILRAISSLARKFGKNEDKSEELMPSEAKQILKGLAGPGQPPSPAGGGAPPGAAAPGAGGPPPPM